jgi:hypothetical protein
MGLMGLIKLAAGAATAKALGVRGKRLTDLIKRVRKLPQYAATPKGISAGGYGKMQQLGNKAVKSITNGSKAALGA